MSIGIGPRFGHVWGRLLHLSLPSLIMKIVAGGLGRSGPDGRRDGLGSFGPDGLHPATTAADATADPPVPRARVAAIATTGHHL